MNTGLALQAIQPILVTPDNFDQVSYDACEAVDPFAYPVDLRFVFFLH